MRSHLNESMICFVYFCPIALLTIGEEIKLIKLIKLTNS